MQSSLGLWHMNLRLFCKFFGMVFCLLFPSLLVAKKTKPKYSIRSDLKITKIRFPEVLDFGHRNIERKSNIFISRPFDFEESLVTDDRYVSAVYLQVYVVHLTSSLPFDPDYKYDEAKAKELNMTLITSRTKDRGDKGKLYHFKQILGDQVYYKWVSVFGNKYQTDIVTALYPQDLELHFVPKLLENLVETAFIGDDLL